MIVCWQGLHTKPITDQKAPNAVQYLPRVKGTVAGTLHSLTLTNGEVWFVRCEQITKYYTIIQLSIELT